MPAYALAERRGSAADLHAAVPGDPAVPEVWVHDVISPALVLGSNQRDEIVDRAACRAAGIDVVGRRSGGGAVLLIPGEFTWIDVIVPRDGPGWSDDVHGPMLWLGRHLAALLTERLTAHRVPGALEVHPGPYRPGRWSSSICFDGLGAGEVSLDGAKLVGISQRRTRAWARLQCTWYSTYEPACLPALLVPSSRPPIGELAPVATIGAAVTESVAGPLAARLSTGWHG